MEKQTLVLWQKKDLLLSRLFPQFQRIIVVSIKSVMNTRTTSEWTTRHSKSPAVWLGIFHTTPSFLLLRKRSRCTFAVRLRQLEKLPTSLTTLRLAANFLRDAPTAHGILFVPGRQKMHPCVDLRKAPAAYEMLASMSGFILFHIKLKFFIVRRIRREKATILLNIAAFCNQQNRLPIYNF